MGGFIDYFQDVRFRLILQVHFSSASAASASLSFCSLPENMEDDKHLEHSDHSKDSCEESLLSHWLVIIIDIVFEMKWCS